MRTFNRRKPLLPSTTVRPHKKTTSSQRDEHLPEKASHRNFSSSLKPKRPQHSQDREYESSSTSCSQSDAREIEKLEHGPRKGQTLSMISQGTKPSRHSVTHFNKEFQQRFCQRQIKYRQQLYEAIESKKNKLEIYEGSHHNDPGCMTYGIVSFDKHYGLARNAVLSWYIMFLSVHKNQKSSFHNRGTKRPSNSRNKLKKHFVLYQTLAFASSEGDEVMIESKDRVTDCVYTTPLTLAASSHISTLYQALLSRWFGQINSVFTRDPDLSDRPYEKSNSFDQQIVKRDFQSPADTHQTEHMVHLVEFLHNWLLVTSSNSPMITDGSFHGISKILISYLYDRTDQKLLAQLPLNEDKEGIVRTNLFLKYQHSMEKVQSEGKEGTKTSGQIAVTKTVGQIRKLMLLKEEHQAKRQKVHMKHDRLLEILKDSEKEKNEKKYYVIKHQDSFHNRGTKIPSNSRNKLKKHFVPYQTLAFASSEGNEVMIESKDRVTDCVYTNPLTPAASSHVTTPDQNRNNEQKEDTLGDKEENEEVDEEEEVADNFQENDENPATSKQLDTVTTRALMQVENRKKEEKEDALGDKEENKVVEQEEVADNFQENDENPATSKQLDTFSTKDPMQVEVNLDLHMFKVGDEATTDVAVEKILENIKVFKSTLKTSFADKSIRLAEGNNKGFKSTFKTSNKGIRLDAGGRASIRLIPEQMLSDDWINSLPAEVRNKFINKSKSIHPEDSVAHFKLLADITATSDSVKTGEKPVEDSLAHFKLLADITTTSGKTEEEPVKHKTTAAQERSKHGSTLVKLYRNVIRNETSRMMKSIDMVVSEAKHLFGVERTQIFFDLLDDELFHFGSAGAILDFVPNMAESFVRQHVTSFFEHACDMMNRLMTLLLGCPGSEILQQMPEQMFISLLQSVMVSFVKSKPKGGKGISSKGTILIMVDSMTFERALGDGIPEGILVRLSCGDKILVGRFADARPERIGASEIGKNNHIHYIFFSYDCRLFIYIPTENGSYWHQLDMQRANRIR